MGFAVALAFDLISAIDNLRALGIIGVGAKSSKAVESAISPAVKGG